MAAGRYSIAARKGRTFTLNFRIVDMDLTSYKLYMQVRSYTSSDVVLLSIDSTVGGVTMDDLGNVGITVDAATMSALPVGRHQYDLEIHSTGGVVADILAGPFIVSAEVTR